MEAQTLILSLLRALRKEDLEKAVKSNLDPFDFLFNYLQRLNNPMLIMLIKSEIVKNWSIIEDYLTHPKKIYMLLWENPELREVLKRKETIKWLNRACENAYRKIYKWVWSD